MSFLELPHPNLQPFESVRLKPEDVTLALLEEAQEIAAHFIETYGETYMPYFLYLEQAIEKKKSDAGNMARVRAAAERLRSKKQSYSTIAASPPACNHSHM